MGLAFAQIPMGEPMPEMPARHRKTPHIVLDGIRRNGALKDAATLKSEGTQTSGSIFAQE